MATITQYCDAEAVKKILSAVGVKLRMEDDKEALSWSIDEASVDIDEYCLQSYTPASLSQSNWAAKQAAWRAAKYLCQRKNNPVPASLAEEVEKREERLEMVRTGLLKIPDAVKRKADVPVMTNQRVRLSPFPQSVSERGRSTGTPQGYTPHDDRTDQNIDYSQ